MQFLALVQVLKPISLLLFLVGCLVKLGSLSQTNVDYFVDFLVGYKL